MEKSSIYKHILKTVVLVIVVAGILSYFAFKKFDINDVDFSDSIKSAENSFNKGDVNLSISELENLLTKNISDEYRVDVLIALASAYAQKGSLEFKEKEYGDMAVRTIGYALAINPNNSNAYRVMAYAYEIMEDYSNAIVNYEKSIALDATNAMAYSGLGHAYDLQGDLVKAEMNLKRAVDIDNTLDHALLNLARVSYKQNNPTEAGKFAQQVLTLSDNNRFLSEAKNILGAIAFEKGDLVAAASLFEEAIVFDAELAHNYLSLAQTRMQTLLEFGVSEDQISAVTTESLSLIDKALVLNPGLTVAYVTQARIFAMLNRQSEARASFDRASQAISSDISLSATEKEEWKQFIVDSIKNNKL